MARRISATGWLIGLAFCLLGANTTPAQQEDVIGIFFDEEGTVNEADVPRGVPQTLYLCILNASQVTGVRGWECLVSWDEEFPILAWNLHGDALNITSPPEFMVGLQYPLPWVESIVLMDFIVGPFQEGLCEFYLHPVSVPSIPGAMAYVAGHDPGLIVPLNWPTGGEEFPVATMNSIVWPSECYVDPPALDFGEIPENVEAWQNFLITNTGGEPLVGAVPASCGIFEITVGAGPFTLQQGESWLVEVNFSPPVPGDYTCNLDLGTEICDPVPIVGTGIPLPPACQLTPTTLDFGDVHVGDEESRILFITNSGGGSLTGAVPDSCGVFQVVSGAGPFSLAADQSHVFTVSFTPPALGVYECDLVIEGICADVPCSGAGIEAEIICSVNPEVLDFGELEIGHVTAQFFTINNTGQVTFSGFVQENCEGFNITVGSGAFTLEPGELRTVWVHFAPLMEGQFACTVSLGTPYCADVLCFGEGIAAPPDEDFLGIYFDEEGTSDYQVVPYPQPLLAYLCILDASEPSGVSGWECLVEWNSQFPVLAWNIYNDGLNVLVPPGFQVGLPEPLPWQQSIVLMELTVGVFQEGTCEFFLHPVEFPSIPGRMAYAAGDNPSQLIPLNWASGDESLPVATILADFPDSGCSIDPVELVFGEIEVGQEDFRTFTIFNSGGLPLAGVVPYSCGVFQVVTGAGEFDLAPGESHDATVRFAPPEPGDYGCVMEFGNEFCEGLPLSGSGYPSDPLCHICPANLEFGAVFVGGSLDMYFDITNTGGGVLVGEVPQACDVFQVIEGDGPFSLSHEESHLVVVRFAPPDLGEFSCALDLGDLCEVVECHGLGVDELPVCTVTPDHLIFCPQMPGTTVDRTFTITNGSITTVLSGFVSADCEAFVVTAGGGPFALTPGEQHEVTVAFTPPGSSSYSCLVSLGTPYCEDVLCQGQGVPQFAASDMVGIAFEESGIGQRLVIPLGEIVTGYLYVRYPSQRSGVVGWEGRFEWSEGFPMVNWNVRGPACNYRRPPEFKIQLDEPLPWQEVTILMDFMVLVDDVGPCNFYLRPLVEPTIPERLAYWPAADHRHIIPMKLPFGDGILPLATINPDDEVVGVSMGPPSLQTTGGSVTLSWTYDPDAIESFHVFRRIDGHPAVRLTSTPLTGHAGRVEFTDPVRDVMSGTRLYYSYSGLQGTAEVGRSTEVMVVWSPNVPLATVLHPNYPNPFNPVTNIAFDLDRSGIVRLEIFDLAGRRVKVLETGSLPAGRHERQWNGLDDTGRPVPSGNYYCRLQTDTTTAMQKMLLLK